MVGTRQKKSAPSPDKTTKPVKVASGKVTKPKQEPKKKITASATGLSNGTGHTITKVFKRRAAESVSTLAASPFAAADMQSELLSGTPADKPPRGSFEITVTRDDGVQALVWSGHKRGPPRKEKFPDGEVLLAEVEKAFNKSKK